MRRWPASLDHPEVAGAQPTVGGQRRRGRIRVVEVVRHDAPAAEQDLAGLARRPLLALVVDDAQLEAGTWAPDRGGDGLDVVARRGRRRGAALGQPVPGDDDRERQLLVDPPDELDGDVGRPGDRDAQAREVVPGAVGVVEDATGRGSAAPGSTVTCSHADALEHPVDVEHRLGEHRRAGDDRGQDARLQPEHVEVGVDHEVAVGRVETGHRHPVGGDQQRPAVGLDDALGHPGRAGGEQDVGRVVGLDGLAPPLGLGP